MDRIPWQDSIAPFLAYLRSGEIEDSVQDSAQDSLLLRLQLDVIDTLVISSNLFPFLCPQDSLLLRSRLNAIVRLTISANPSPPFCSRFEVQPSSCLYAFFLSLAMIC